MTHRQPLTAAERAAVMKEVSDKARMFFETAVVFAQREQISTPAVMCDILATVHLSFCLTVWGQTDAIRHFKALAERARDPAAFAWLDQTETRSDLQ